MQIKDFITQEQLRFNRRQFFYVNLQWGGHYTLPLRMLEERFIDDRFTPEEIEKALMVACVLDVGHVEKIPHGYLIRVIDEVR